MRMTESQANILARFIEAIRPDWNFHGVKTALGNNANRGNAHDLAIAMITAAADPTAETPAAVTNPTYWPQIGPTAEQDRVARVKTDQERARSAALLAEARKARETAADPETIRAIRNQATRRTA